MSSERKFDLWMLLTLLVVSLSLNVWLYHRAAAGGVFAVSQALPPLEAGAKVPPMQVQTMDGHSTTLAWDTDGRPTLVYVFLTTCPWCEKNLPNVKFLSNAIKQSARVVGVVLDGEKAPAYIAAKGLPFTVYQKPDPETIKQFRLGGVPETIYIDAKGKIIGSWMGAYTGVVSTQVEKQFNLRLPGLSS